MAVKVMVAPAIAKGELGRLAPATRADASKPAERPAAQVPVRSAARASAKPKRRRSAVYDADGNEVLITLMCQKCHRMRPLSLFGLRKMPDGTIRNQPWCRNCRSGAGTGKGREEASAPEESSVSADSPAANPAPTPAEAANGSNGKRRNPAAEIAAILDAGRG